MTPLVDVASGKFIGTMASDAKTPDEITEEYCQSKYYKYLSDEATSTVISSSSDAKQSTFVTRRPW
jgi:hypothetical protein